MQQRTVYQYLSDLENRDDYWSALLVACLPRKIMIYG